MVPLMWININAAILSSMVGGGESHAGFVGQEVTLHSFKKLCAKRCVLGCKDTEDGPLCVVTLQESSRYCAYVCNYLLDDADLFMAKKFRNRFRLPYTSYKDLLTQIKLDDRFECGHLIILRIRLLFQKVFIANSSMHSLTLGVPHFILFTLVPRLI